MSKKAKIITGVTVGIIAIAIIIVMLVFCFTPVGLNNRKSIRIECYNSGYVNIPVKMVKGFYSPSMNSFNSDLSTEELCELTVKQTDQDYTYEYELYGDNAIIYAISSGTQIGFAELIKLEEGNRFDYCLMDGNTYCESDKTIDTLFPLHLTLNNNTYIFKQESTLKDNVTFDDIIDFYNTWFDGNVEVETNRILLTNEKDNIIIYLAYNQVNNSIVYTSNKI